MLEKELIEYLGKFVSARRLKLFDEVLSERTKYITVVLEDIYQPHNASAVLRTCDCLGIQEVNIIENRNKYNVNPDVSLGSDKWLTIIRYNEKSNNTKEAYNKLHRQGYRIVASSLHEKKAVSLEKFDVKRGKIALVLGTEMHGLSREALDGADEYLKIPMYGFTESYNISVSAAIITYQLLNLLRKTEINWGLTEDEKLALKLDWLRRSIKKPELLEKKFHDMKNNNQ